MNEDEDRMKTWDQNTKDRRRLNMKTKKKRPMTKRNDWITSIH